MSSLLLAYVAGVVTILSPCVLPLLPIIMGSALETHRRGPVALIAGLVLSFTGFGMLVATLGFSIGLTADVLQKVAAVIMVGFGLILMCAPLYQRFSLLASAATNGVSTRVAAYAPQDLKGQFGLGVLMGAVWTPCVGPTLGAAIALAAQGQALGHAAAVMFVFALGTVTPIMALILASRETILRRKQAMASAGRWLKPTVGLLFTVVGLLFLTGLMKTFEAAVLSVTPEWLTAFVYRF